MKRYIFFLSLCLLLPTAFVFAQPGTLDSSFSSDGLVRTKIGAFGDSWARSIAIQSDQKIIIGGLTYTGSVYDFALVRYNTNGGPDNGFGTNGQVTTSFNGPGTGIESLLIQANGMIVAGGVSNFGAVMARYKKNGTLDSSFGIDGKVTSDFGGNEEGIYSLAFQTDGKIIAAGTSDGKFAVARYKQNGTRDSTFGTNGLVTTSTGNNTTNGGRAVSLQTDGKIVVAGFRYPKNGIHDAVLIRYKKNGEIDSSFGVNGIVITDLGSANDYYTSVVIRSDGKIITAGAAGGSFQLNFVVAQYNKKGKLDSGFGTNGFTTTDFSTTDDKANSLALQADGKIVVAGSTESTQVPSYVKFALARYMQNGILDSTFGTNGQLTTDFGGRDPDGAYALAIQQDGKIVGTGRSGIYAAVARYNSDSSNLHFAKTDNLISQQQTDKSISLSPNPVKDVLYLRDMSTNKKNIAIVSENGSTSQHFATENSSFTINTRQLKAGVYFVKIIEGEKTTTLKFLKE